MRTSQHSAHPQPVEGSKRKPPAFTFVCIACEMVEHRRTPALPEGWAVYEISHDLYAYCPDCAIDLPRRPNSQDPVQ